MHYLGNVPNSNQEFDDIEAMLAKLGVEYIKIDVYKKSPEVFTRVYKISADEAAKLPHEDDQPWLPVDEESGHKLTPDREGMLWRHYIDRQYSMAWLTPDEFNQGANRILKDTRLLRYINENPPPIDIHDRVSQNCLYYLGVFLQAGIDLSDDEVECRNYREMIEFISTT